MPKKSALTFSKKLFKVIPIIFLFIIPKTGFSANRSSHVVKTCADFFTGGSARKDLEKLADILRDPQDNNYAIIYRGTSIYLDSLAPQIAFLNAAYGDKVVNSFLQTSDLSRLASNHTAQSYFSPFISATQPKYDKSKFNELRTAGREAYQIYGFIQQELTPILAVLK